MQLAFINGKHSIQYVANVVFLSHITFLIVCLHVLSEYAAFIQIFSYCKEDKIFQLSLVSIKTSATKRKKSLDIYSSSSCYFWEEIKIQINPNFIIENSFQFTDDVLNIYVYILTIFYTLEVKNVFF